SCRKRPAGLSTMPLVSPAPPPRLSRSVAGTSPPSRDQPAWRDALRGVSYTSTTLGPMSACTSPSTTVTQAVGGTYAGACRCSLWSARPPLSTSDPTTKWPCRQLHIDGVVRLVGQAPLEPGVYAYSRRKHSTGTES